MSSGTRKKKLQMMDFPDIPKTTTNNVSQKWVDYQIDVIRMTESDFYTTSPAFVPKGGK